MNHERRRVLDRALNELSTAKDLISDALDEEQECLGNMPENLEGSERYANMESAIDYMQEAIDSIDSATEAIDSAHDC